MNIDDNKKKLKVMTKGVFDTKLHKEIHYQIKVPKINSITVSNYYGDIIIDETDADVNLGAAYGSIIANKLNGELATKSFSQNGDGFVGVPASGSCNTSTCTVVDSSGQGFGDRFCVYVKLYIPGAKPVKSIGELTIGSVLNVPCVHCPLGSSFSNSVNKSKVEGKSTSQIGVPGTDVPDVNVSYIVIVTVAV